MAQSVNVVGATGTIGSLAVTEALAAGARVRVCLREASKKSGPFRARGIDFVEFDWTRRETYAAAVADVAIVICVTPFAPAFADDVAALCAAAKEAGATHFVKLSTLGAGPKPKSPKVTTFAIGAEHGKADAAVLRSGIGSVVQSNLFMSNVVTFQKTSIQSKGEFYGSSNGKSVSYVDPADVAALLVKIALDKPPGGEYVATGPAFTDANCAKALAKHLDRQVAYVNLPYDALYDANKQKMPNWVADAMRALEMLKGEDLASAVSNDIQALLGRPPRTFSDYLRTALPNL